MNKPKGQGGRLEARARDLSPRGFPYQLGDLVLPRNEWVGVTQEQAGQIEFMQWPVTVREKEAPAPGAPGNKAEGG